MFRSFGNAGAQANARHAVAAHRRRVESVDQLARRLAPALPTTRRIA
jgi:hypothetical protein